MRSLEQRRWRIGGRGEDVVLCYMGSPLIPTKVSLLNSATIHKLVYDLTLLDRESYWAGFEWMVGALGRDRVGMLITALVEPEEKPQREDVLAESLCVLMERGYEWPWRVILSIKGGNAGRKGRWGRWGPDFYRELARHECAWRVQPVANRLHEVWAQILEVGVWLPEEVEERIINKLLVFECYAWTLAEKMGFSGAEAHLFHKRIETRTVFTRLLRVCGDKAVPLLKERLRNSCAVYYGLPNMAYLPEEMLDQVVEEAPVSALALLVMDVDVEVFRRWPKRRLAKLLARGGGELNGLGLKVLAGQSVQR